MRISDWSSDVCSSDLIEISIATGKIGGALHRQALSDELAKRGFRLTGDRNFGPSRERLEEMARLTLANIGDTLAGVHLPRLAVIAQVDAALDQPRFGEVCGDAGEIGREACRERGGPYV